MDQEPGRLRRFGKRVRAVFGGTRSTSPPPNPWVATVLPTTTTHLGNAGPEVAAERVDATSTPAVGRAAALVVWDSTCPGVTPDDPNVGRIIHASTTDEVEAHFIRTVNELHGRDRYDGSCWADLEGADLLSAKEAAITLLHAEMILPSPRYLGVSLGSPELFLGKRRKSVMAEAHGDGDIVLNARFFGEGRRSTLLEVLQVQHDRNFVIGGGHYGGAPALLHEKMHTLLSEVDPPDAKSVNTTDKAESKTAGLDASSSTVNAPPVRHARESARLRRSAPDLARSASAAEARPPRPAKKIGRSFDPASTNSPHALEPLGGYARRSPGERWAEGGRLVAGFGSAAPKEAREVWEYAVPMDAGRWAALDRQVANLHRTLDALYERTDPATGQQLVAVQDRAYRASSIAASKGFNLPRRRGRGFEVNGTVHGINASSQKVRDNMPTLPTWVGRGQRRDPPENTMDII